MRIEYIIEKVFLFLIVAMIVIIFVASTSDVLKDTKHENTCKRCYVQEVLSASSAGAFVHAQYIYSTTCGNKLSNQKLNTGDTICKEARK